MKLNISFKHVDPSDALKSVIEEKSESLKKFFDGRITVDWVISKENINRIVHCHLVGNGMNYFGEGSTSDFRASVDQAFDKIETQLRKHKEIVTSHHGHGHANRATDHHDQSE